MSDETTKVINDKQFVALVKAVDENKTKVASLNGTIGERVKHAVDNAHLHPGAFKLICKLYRMDEQKRDEFLRQFDIYREKSIKTGLFGEEHVGDLADMAERDQEAADEAQIAQNVRRLKAGIKELPPEDRELDDATSSKPSRRRAKNKEQEPDSADEAAGTYTLQ